MIRTNFIVFLLFANCLVLVVMSGEATNQPRTLKSKQNSESSYDIEFQSHSLQAKRIELEQRLKRLRYEQGCPKPEPIVDNCQKLKNETEIKRVELDLKYQNQVNQRMIYQSKWQTTCQSWKHQMEVLKNKTKSQQQELKSNSLKIQQMADQIAILTVQLKQAQICPSCPACPIEKCPECLECLDCPTDTCNNEPELCPECEQCGSIKDEFEDLKEEYTQIYRKFQTCEQQLEQCQSTDKTDESDCTQSQQEAVDSLSQVVSNLNQNLSKQLKVSRNLQQIIKTSSQKIGNSNSIKDSVQAVRLLIDGIITELQSQSKPCIDNNGPLLDQCLSTLKRAIDKLKVCEDKLTPLIASSK